MNGQESAVSVNSASGRTAYGALTRRSPRAGFSLIEALVVLAIGSMALALIFSIGRSATSNFRCIAISASDNGFRLGRNALTAADNEIAVADARTAIGSLLIRPVAVITDPEREAIMGTATSIEGEAVMRRATACAPRGWQGRLRLSIQPVGGRPALFCHAGRKSVRLMLLGPGAVFSYSTDGTLWAPAWTNAPSSPTGVVTAPPLESASIYLRLSNPGGPDIMETVSTGFPSSWFIPSDDI